MRLNADGRLLRINADGEIVHHHVQNALPDLADIPDIVGQGLGVGEQHELPVGVLVFQTVSEGSGIMSQMKRAGRAIAGEYDGV